ncbi:hypothetical protein ABPG75_004334 [Micractinium tetrahymenae]
MGEAPKTRRGVKEAISRCAAHDDLDEKAEAAGKKYAGIWMHEEGRSIEPSYGIKRPPSWSGVVQDPPPEADAPPLPVDSDRSKEQPFFAVHNLRSEVEAALAVDYGNLWLKLHSRGMTEKALRRHRWNLPQLRLWDQPALLAELGQFGLDMAANVQSLARNSLPQLPELKLLPKERQRLRAKQVAAAAAEREEALQRMRAHGAASVAERRRQVTAKRREEAAARKRAAAVAEEASRQQKRARLERQARRDQLRARGAA